MVSFNETTSCCWTKKLDYHFFFCPLPFKASCLHVKTIKDNLVISVRVGIPTHIIVFNFFRSFFEIKIQMKTNKRKTNYSTVEIPIRKILSGISSFEKALGLLEEYDFENYGVLSL